LVLLSCIYYIAISINNNCWAQIKQTLVGLKSAQASLETIAAQI